MKKKRIESRKEVDLLVRTFYSKVREDELLGPIFNKIITDWEEHFELLTDFWESNLFFTRKYYGNPLLAHVEVDRKIDNTTTEMHFGVWLNLWYQTIDELFEADDEKALAAKNRARHMGTSLYVNMFKSRTFNVK